MINNLCRPNHGYLKGINTNSLHFPYPFHPFFYRAKFFCQKVNLKIKKLSDIGGFQWPEVEGKKRS